MSESLRIAKAGGQGVSRLRLSGFGLEALVAFLVLLTGAAIYFQDSILDRTLRFAPARSEAYNAYFYADGAPGGSVVAAEAAHPLTWNCILRAAARYPYCGYGLQFDVLNDGRGIDLSNFHTLRLRFAYQGEAETLRLDLKNREPALGEFALVAGDRVNSIDFPIAAGRQTVELALEDFEVAAWWLANNRIPGELRAPAFNNVTALEMQTGNGARPGRHRLRIDEILLEGQVLTTERYYAIIAGGWLVVIALLLVWRRRQARAAQRSEAARWRRTLDAIPQMVWSVSEEGEAFTNARWVEFTDGVPESGRSEDWWGLVHPDDREMVEARWQRSREAGEAFEAEYRLRHQGGDYRYVLGRALPDRGEDGAVVRWYGTCTDIHDRFVAQQELWRTQSFTRQLIDASPDVILVTDEAGNIAFANTAAAAGFGVEDKTELVGRSWLRLVTPDIRRSALSALAANATQESRRFLAEKLSGAGPKSWWDVVLTPLAGGKRRERFLVVARDISHQKKAEEQARWSSRHDPLTQLPNRLVLQQELDRLVRDRRPFAVMILDIDEFKKINDSLGHDAGDAVLGAFAERLRNAVEPENLVARLGGDEFAVLLNGARREKVGVVAARIFAALRDPCLHEGTLIDWSSSIGASLFPGDGATRSTLLKNADVALYVAKASGRKNLKIFDPRMLTDAEMRHGMISTARQALQEDTILPFYQPKFELETGRIVGLEALLRWQDPVRGVQTPDTIMAAFEDLGLAGEISNRMIERALCDARGWLERGLDFGHIAFNASAAELRSTDFADRMLDRLERFGIPVRHVQLEVSETVFLGRGAEFVESTLRSLSASGIRIAIDDFGTGFASLSHLKSFPVDFLKVDRSFIRHLQTDPGDSAIVDAVIGLGRSLHIEVIAEGIETQAQHDALVALGCKFGQGFLYSHPVAADEVVRLCTVPPRGRSSAAA